MSNETTEVPANAYLKHEEIVPILVGLMMGMFLAALDQTIVATSIRTIGDQLNGLSLQAWVTTAYLITSTITTPLYGKLSDIFGRKPLFIWAISLFIFGSLMSAFANSMFMLAAFRAVQGLGAGDVGKDLRGLADWIDGFCAVDRRDAHSDGLVVHVVLLSISR